MAAFRECFVFNGMKGSLMKNCGCLVCGELKHENFVSRAKLPTKDYKAFSFNLIPLSNAVRQGSMENVWSCGKEEVLI